MKRRMFVGLLGMTLLFGLLIGRMFWIQVISVHHFSAHKVNLVEMSVQQRRDIIVVDDGRAHFYDRHMNALTGQAIDALAIFPIRGMERGTWQAVQQLAAVLNVPEDRFAAYIDELKVPELWQGGWQKQAKPMALDAEQVQAINSLKLQGVQVVRYNLRYEEPYVASHLIGFVAQNPQRINEQYSDKLASGRLSHDTVIGAAGLELSLDHYMHGHSPKTLALFTDGRFIPMAGLSMRNNDFQSPLEPLNVMTTIDKEMQRQIEDIVDEASVGHGAIVVLDAGNADVLAMVSRPHFDPYDVQPSAHNWGNKALKAYTPGSTFKTVVAAAALEGRYTTADEIFNCEGSLGKYGMSCWKKGGHGQISFEDAFVHSCNVTFAKVMTRIPTSILEQTAYKLGLAQHIGWSESVLPAQGVLSQFASEEAGQIYASDLLKTDSGARAQTAIGQRDVLVTPLQAANMIVTLLHDGQLMSPRVVHSIAYADHRLYDKFQSRTLLAKQEGISTNTARTLQRWMGRVVSEGTGRMLNDSSRTLAGKTGTAQVVIQGQEKYNQWFIGFAPIQKPQYAVAILVQNNLSSHQATEIFGKIMATIL